MNCKEVLKELKPADALEYTERILNTVNVPLIILYRDLNVAFANRALYQTLV